MRKSPCLHLWRTGKGENHPYGSHHCLLTSPSCLSCVNSQNLRNFPSGSLGGGGGLANLSCLFVLLTRTVCWFLEPKSLASSSHQCFRETILLRVCAATPATVPGSRAVTPVLHVSLCMYNPLFGGKNSTRAQFHHGNCAYWSRLGALFVAVEQSSVVRSCDNGETLRQEGVLYHARPVRLAHFYNHEVGCWRQCRPIRKRVQQATGGDLV